MEMHRIHMENVHKDFYSERDSLRVLDDINIYADEGEFISIIGPSGCGKSTIFHILTGLVNEYEGSVQIDGIPLSEYDKRVGYMHQKDLLMPWRNLIDNVIIPLEIQGEKKSDAKKKVMELLPVFGLEGFEKSYPSELSGGMRQRAALLRTVLVESDIMLLDEPFGALDAISRSKMQKWLLEIWSRFKRTVMFITHDIEEAIFLSDRVYVLTNRPATVLKEVKIDFERPRNKEILVSQKFLDYKKILMDAL
ncbi:NitT/TauT family transport system ATP-binding protein [Peptoclostridium litorale DSM 5388]|uniref:Putative ABC transporter ATP-binding protein n=1 Tax=Peptoclostridium litorale DSM 5388 TaxID=1121324 RepID=A0A069RHB2_PEPLI|nr:ABC transporter ATP-binding protein [Peptoclostridium litorale]KDR95555.1 putative ABC transporter ATP-binding protein [Peptoclostridium litorale DSM 5388]SIN98195.1 NitT/TauT family transport system ATP-binding protein [Peptoclostridium litorale DSM 5388]